MTAFEAYLFIGPVVLGISVLAIRAGGEDVFRRKRKVAELAEDARAIERAREAAARAKRIAEARLPEGRVLVNLGGPAYDDGKGGR